MHSLWITTSIKSPCLSLIKNDYIYVSTYSSKLFLPLLQHTKHEALFLHGEGTVHVQV